MRLCSIIDCLEPVGRKTGDHCEAHAKRAKRRQSLVAPVARRAALDNPFAVLLEAAVRYANASSEDDDEFERAKDNLRQAAKRYGRPR